MQARVLIGTQAQWTPAMWRALGQFRYQVFVRHLGWCLPSEQGCEWDAFDAGQVIHALRLNSRDRVIGYGRLLPTLQPHPMQDVFAVPGHQPAADIWELSRLVSIRQPGERDAIQALAAILRPLLDLARSRGIRRVVGLTTAPVAAIFQALGYSVVCDGAVDRSDVPSVLACHIDLPPLAGECPASDRLRLPAISCGAHPAPRTLAVDRGGRHAGVALVTRRGWPSSLKRGPRGCPDPGERRQTVALRMRMMGP